MRLNTIQPAEGSKHAHHRVGRGVGSGWGKTAGRGHHHHSGGVEVGEDVDLHAHQREDTAYECQCRHYQHRQAVVEREADYTVEHGCQWLWV